MANQYFGAVVLKNSKVKEREAQIAEILNKGGIVKFTNTLSGVIKFVNNGEKDADGDLVAFKHTGVTPFVCWRAAEYEIAEAKPEEYSSL